MILVAPFCDLTVLSNSQLHWNMNLPLRREYRMHKYCGTVYYLYHTVLAGTGGSTACYPSRHQQKGLKFFPCLMYFGALSGVLCIFNCYLGQWEHISLFFFFKNLGIDKLQGHLNPSPCSEAGDVSRYLYREENSKALYIWKCYMTINRTKSIHSKDCFLYVTPSEFRASTALEGEGTGVTALVYMYTLLLLG